MLPRKYISTACSIASALVLISPINALTQEPAKAQVTSRIDGSDAHLVFDWNGQNVPFTITTRGNKVVLHFDEPVALDWDSLLTALAPYVRQVETQNKGSVVILTTTNPVEAKHFLSYGRNGIDFKKNGVDLTETPHKTPVVTMATPTAHPHKTLNKVAHSKPQIYAKAPPHSFPLAKIAPPSVTLTHVAPIALNPQEEAQKLARLSPAAGSGAESEAPHAAPTAVKSGTEPASMPTSEETADKEIIALPFKEGDAFAVFIKQKTLWVVADSNTHLTPDMLHKPTSHFTKDAEKIADPHAAILHMPLLGDPAVIIKKSDQGTVNLVLTHSASKSLSSLVPVIHSNAAKQAFISVAMEKPGQVVSFHDPATSEELYVTPSSAIGSGLPAALSFAEFTLLQSPQGMAVQKIAADMTVTTDKDTVTIVTSKGLNVSHDMEKHLEEIAASAASERGHSVLFPYAQWKLDDEKNMVPVERRLVHDIAYGSMADADAARLKLLGIYLSKGLFAETRGMADDILRTSVKFYIANKVAAMRGASYFFMYRITDAQRDFSSPELLNNPEAKMWRTLCNELLGEGTEKFDFLANYDPYIRNYPPVFIQKLAIIAADRAINRKEYDVATTIFDTLKKDNLDEPVKKYVDYMRAKVFSETRNEEEAAKIWEQQAADVDDPLIRARAEFSLINMLLRQEKITHEDAIKRLDKLRIVWRGDSLELSVLTLLGNLYVEEKQYAKALHTFRDIVLYYPEVPGVISIAKQMEEIFVTLYNKGGADAMPPLDALTLFYEFRDLVPLGKDGDLMIRNLADRLVNIDLLDRAATLLDHQIRKRLQGDERSRIGARLALIYLLNHQPKEALDTLKTTGFGDLPADLQLTRLRLTAQALAQQGHVDKAIDVLSSDNSMDGTLLRLSIYWDNKDWPNVVTTAEEILGNRNDPSAPLSAQESDVLLKLATAYVYEHDSGQIQYLRDYFTPLLKNNANKDSFLFITSESGAIDYENLANLDQDITAVKTFLDTYRDQVKKNGLSKTIN